MDKVRAFLKVVYQQRFWVLSVVGVIIAAVCWMMASGSLDAEFTVNKQKIQGEFTNMDKISKTIVHGNDAVNQAERKQKDLIQAQVLKLWKKMYALQREKVLKWPELLGDEFLTYVEGKKFRDPISDPDIRQIYREFAKDRFPALVEIVKAKKMVLADGAMGGGGGRGGGEYGGYAGGRGTDSGAAPEQLFDPQGNPIVTEKYILEWLDQGMVQQELTFSDRPSSLQIWVTQEDLWVYETLLHVIANTNDANNATRSDNAAVRTIMALEVGQLAAFAPKVRGTMILPPAAAGAEGMADPSGMGARVGEGTDMAAAGADPDAALLANRYIGEDGAAIADASTVAGGEFRRLPVRMLLMMDPTAIPSILIECANAALPIEVKRVRINSDMSGAGFDQSMAVAAVPGMEGGGGHGGSTDSGVRGYGSSGGGGRGGEMMSSIPTDGSASGLASIEIQGIVYIYNPPDESTLSAPESGEPAVAAADTGAAAL